jgi:hypothetical protein
LHLSMFLPRYRKSRKIPPQAIAYGISSRYPLLNTHTHTHTHTHTQT